MFIYLFEEAVVGLFGGAYFYRLHHFAGGDDDAADEFGWWGAGHGVCVCVWFLGLKGVIVWKGGLGYAGHAGGIGLDC